MHIQEKGLSAKKINQCIIIKKRGQRKAMVIIICEFNYQILYQSSMHLFLRGKMWENLKMLPLPVAGEALPWKPIWT